MNFLEQFGSQGTFIFMVIVLAISFVLLMRTSRYYSRQRRDKPAWSRDTESRPGGSSTAGSSKAGRNFDAMPEIARLQVDMHDTAREMKAQLDSKMSALQALIADADRAAARLEAALKKEK